VITTERAGLIKKIFLYIGTYTYIHTMLYPRRGSRGIPDTPETPTPYQNEFATRNTADVTGGEPIAVLLQPISGVSAIL
jgi:hypothetical protein